MKRPLAEKTAVALAALAVACTPAPASTTPAAQPLAPPTAKPSPPAPAPASDRFALLHVTVVDVAHGTEQADRAVVVENGHIVAVTAADAVPASPPARPVEARGKWVIPGLWDMHVHFADPSWSELFVANGVTGVRVMWGNPQFAPGMERWHFDMRDAFEKGEHVGPRMVIASNIMDGPKPVWPNSAALGTPDEGRKAVDDAKRDGVDFIKVYSLLPRDVFFAIAEESKKVGLPFAGHVPDSVSVLEASDAGQKSIEHLTGMIVACSSHEADLLKKRAAFGAAPHSRPEWFAFRVKENADAIASYDESKCKELGKKLAQNGTWQTPTLTVLDAMATLDDPKHASDPRLVYASAFMKKQWDPKEDFRTRGRKPEDWAALRASFKQYEKLVGAMRDAGVGILAGTDEVNPYCFAGFSLHDELGWLVESGLSPAEALRAATLAPAQYLGREAKAGTVEEGKDADLVVLDADPLADVHNTQKIAMVVLRGRLHDRAALDAMLAHVKDAAAHPRWGGGGFAGE